ncbi:MAG: efflux RND transporter permease subunit [Planctomycetes bacterium]|nr:efflux RND transporter permease subunit [Planctomycetota bacterium]
MNKDTFLTRFVARFLEGHNSVLLLSLALALGVAAVLMTPREEEPQIVVPMADVFVEAPGYSAEEVERLAARPLEKLLWHTDGVEHVYSVSQRDRAMVTVRFFVGENREDSLVKLRDRLQQNLDAIPDLIQSWVVKPVEIDDVPIVTLALYGDGFDEFALRRMGEEMQSRLDQLRNVSRTQLVGGARREVAVKVDREAMHARGLTLPEVAQAIQIADRTADIGEFDRGDQHLQVSIGQGFPNVPSLAALVLAGKGKSQVFLRDIASISDGPEELTQYTRIRFGAGETSNPSGSASVAAVTLAVSKQKGSDATKVAASVLAEAERLRREVFPAGLQVRVTRNYGETADEKVNSLLSSIAFALISVVALLLVTLGWREALVVALAVPVSFSLALLVNALLGYTINRVTLFALILSLGLVVDDPITNVDNIQRHLRKRAAGAKQSVLNGVREVLPPVIMSTLTIIVSFLPMFFITGMMGPYMAPMAANVPLTVAFSTLAAVTVVPWLAYKLMKHLAVDKPNAKVKEPTPAWLRKMYRASLAPFLKSRLHAYLLVGAVFALFVGASILPLFGKVPLKMLPFDNKNELQLVIDLPEGSTLERTDAVARQFEDYLAQVPEVADLESFVGTASPMDFNGMVRHTYLRQSPELADIRINLLHSSKRDMQSHGIAMRLRDELQQIADRNQATIRLVETPPGPPVLATVVAEIRGDEGTAYSELIAASYQLRDLMQREPGLREADVMAAEVHDRVRYVLDRQQAAMHGVNEEQVTDLVGIAIKGRQVATMREDRERQQLPINLRLPREQRSGLDELGILGARTAEGSMVPLQGIGQFERVSDDGVIYHKNLQPVVYVTAEMVGRAPGEAVLAMQSALQDQPLPANINVEWAGEGEWEITLRVFRDMGLAYIAALIFIYLLLTIETKSLVMPLLVMMAIPLTAIGMMPGFWGLNAFVAGDVNGYSDSVFFTATAMIGMIALGGIVVRNSLVLLQFIQNELTVGTTLREAIFASGAVRMRPILLTAGTTALGAWPITLDPIFSGLAWALIFGLLASTAFTLLVVPAVFWLISEKKYRPANEASKAKTSKP